MASEQRPKTKFIRLLARFTGLSFLKRTLRTWQNRRVDLGNDKRPVDVSGERDSRTAARLADDAISVGLCRTDTTASLVALDKGDPLLTPIIPVYDERLLCVHGNGGQDLPEEVLLDRILSGDSDYLRVVSKVSENQYVFGGLLGAGSFSKVRLALDRYSGQQVAIKLISLADIQRSVRLRKTLLREIHILRTIHHSNIASFFEVTVIGRSIGLVMEYFAGVELFQHVSESRRLGEGETKTILRQLLRAVEYLHGTGIAHRDLKLENILIQTNASSGIVVKLIDFGLARMLDPSGTAMTTRCGSEEYAAPEIILGQPYDGRLSDLWSIGVILYACLLGSLPFNPDAGRPRSLVDKIVQQNYRLVEGWISTDAVSMIRSLLVRDPLTRPTASQLLRHPFLCP